MVLAADAFIDLDALDGIRAKLGLTWEDLAATIGVDNATLYRWRQGKSSPRPIYRSRLRQIGELIELLPQLFKGPDVAREWLRSSRPESLGGMSTPLDLMKDGRIDQVLLLLYNLARGG